MLRRKTPITTFIITLLFLSFLVPTTVSAVTLPEIDITKARGTVLDANGNPVKFAKVYGNCSGEDSKSLTNSKGEFKLHFVSKNGCSEGDQVFVTAEADGNTYHGSGIVVMKKDGKIVDINFAQLSFAVFNVPEYNQITGFAAIFLSLGSVIIFRKKDKMNLSYLRDFSKS